MRVNLVDFRLLHGDSHGQRLCRIIFPCFKVGNGRVSGSFTPRIPAEQEGFGEAMLNDKELAPSLDELID